MTVPTAVGLPAALTRWSSTLDVLEPRLATALGPMVRSIDELVHRGDLATAAHGEIDGYGGLGRRGDPSRLVVSQWALAEVAPLEFLRRAAAAELLYLEPSHLDERPRGRVTVLVDSGPDQVGAGRLVQLATLIVLIGRAGRRGAELQLGVLGEQPADWITGRAQDLLDRWLRSRRSDAPADVAAELERWTDDLEDADETWVLAGPRTAAALPGRRRLVVATECAWTADGASAVDAVVDGHRAELALPHGDVAVRALRGALIRRAPTASAAPDEPSQARGPFTFTSANATLLARGDTPSTLVRLEVRPDSPGRPKAMRFGGRVVTAAAIGRRVVALVERDGVVRVEVRGKRLGRTADIAIPVADLPVAPEDNPVDFAQLVYASGTLLARLGDAWWELDGDGARPSAYVVAARGSQKPDEPALAFRHRTGVYVQGSPLSGPDTDPLEIVIGPPGMFAWRIDSRRWRGADGREVELDEGESVLGVHEIDGACALVVLSAAGVTLRVRWPAGSRTLTAWSGGTGRPSVHPTLPWVAVQRPDGAVEVGDLSSGEIIFRSAAP